MAARYLPACQATCPEALVERTFLWTHIAVTRHRAQLFCQSYRRLALRQPSSKSKANFALLLSTVTSKKASEPLTFYSNVTDNQSIPRQTALGSKPFDCRHCNSTLSLSGNCGFLNVITTSTVKLIRLASKTLACIVYRASLLALAVFSQCNNNSN